MLLFITKGVTLKKLTLALLVLLAYLTGCCTSFPPLTYQGSQESKSETIQHLSRSTAALVALKPDNTYSVYCSAVWVGPSRLLTARHCVEPEITGDLHELFDIKPDLNQLVGVMVTYSTYDERDITFKKDEGEQPHWATVVAFDKENDLALLESIDVVEHDYVSLSANQPWTGQEVHIIGHTIKLQYNYFPGVVSAPQRDMTSFFPTEDEKHIMLHITAPVAPGNSGGGAFDQNGNLLGICSFIALRAPNASFFVGRDKIEAFLLAN